eukprot:4082023-Pyramimonas_sp.AAC.2
MLQNRGVGYLVWLSQPIRARMMSSDVVTRCIVRCVLQGALSADERLPIKFFAPQVALPLLVPRAATK